MNIMTIRELCFCLLLTFCSLVRVGRGWQYEQRVARDVSVQVGLGAVVTDAERVGSRTSHAR